MEQVLINLMLNAIEAVQEKPEAKIWLEYGKENNYVFIRIKDNGKGIPAEYIDKVFVPFFTTKKKGSGIGLSLSKQILLAHKGNITVSSSAGKGTAITVKIPKE
jgi:signal transduction histidine kinase